MTITWQNVLGAWPPSCLAWWVQGNGKREALALTRHQYSIQYESSRMAHGASKRRWEPYTTRDTPKMYKWNWSELKQFRKNEPFETAANHGCVVKLNLWTSYHSTWLFPKRLPYWSHVVEYWRTWPENHF